MGVFADTCGRQGARLLLFLELLVASVSADCARPAALDETMLSEGDRQKSSFPEGASVTLACDLGYNRTSGSGLVTCLGGKWTQPDLVCTKNDCGGPPEQPNMIHDLSGGTHLGAIIKVSCKEGYQISGSTNKQCFANGWLGRSRCIAKDCRVLAAQPNMVVSIPNGTLYGAEAEVSCKSGYKLIGSRIRRCENNGWSGSPRCEPVTCGAVRVLANGRSSWDSDSDSLTAGQTIDFACDKGHVLAGASTIVCQEDGTYDKRPPTCLKAVHPTTPVPVVVKTNTFIERQGHIALLAALASVAFAVCMVCGFVQNIFSSWYSSMNNWYHRRRTPVYQPRCPPNPCYQPAVYSRPCAYY